LDNSKISANFWLFFNCLILFDFFSIHNFGSVQKEFQLTNIYPNIEVIVTTQPIFRTCVRNMPKTAGIQIPFRAAC